MMVDYPIIPDEEMSRWEAWIENTTGIVLQGRKRVLEQGIYPRLLACGLSNLDQYRELIDQSPQGPTEKVALIDQLTVKDSRFFRDAASLDAVGSYLLRRSREIDADSHQFRLWSVGCALGQETYSLAMVASEQLAYTNIDWQVMGTDISPSSVMYATRGAYLDKQVAGVSAQRMTRFFDLEQEHWRVQDHLREHVRFGASNLKHIESCPYREQDVIFCQNVLIYFSEEQVNHILEQLVDRLRPGGLLVLGAGEASGWTSERVSRWKPDSLNAYVRANGNEL